MNVLDLYVTQYWNGDDISIKFVESKLRSKAQNPTQVIITSPSTKVLQTATVFVSTVNKLQLVKFLCKHASTYTTVNENSEIDICRGFDDTTKCFKFQDFSDF